MPIGQGAIHRSHRLDDHAIDFQDLVPEQVDEVVAAQADSQFVDHDALVPLEDLDGDHVTAHRADPAGHRPEGAGSVGQLDPDQVVAHDLRLGRHCVHTVSCRLRHRVG